MKSKYSKKSNFEDVPLAGSPIYKLAFRLVAQTDTKIISSGTCVMIAQGLVITAKHVIEDYLETLGYDSTDNEQLNPNFALWIVQITDDSDYAVWDAKSMWLSPHTDIAFLNIVPYNGKALKLNNSGVQSSIELFPPSVGARVVGFGFHSKEVDSYLSFSPDGTKNIIVNDKPKITVGEIKEIYNERRDSSMLNFPSYRVSFKSLGGMSGGPVFNDDGKLCGLISTGIQYGNNEYEANVITLWPMLGTIISANRGKNYPQNIQYPIMDLAKDNIINAVGWEKVIFNEKTNKISWHPLKVHSVY